MSDTILNDYKSYYRTRANRFANDPDYPESYKAEKEMSDTLESCSQLEEFQEHGQRLSQAAAKALIIDEYTLEKKYYDKHDEIVRAQAAEEILSKINNINDINEIFTLVSDVTTANSRAISLDESHRQLQYDWDAVDDIWVYENAEVPSEYQSVMDDWAEDKRNSLRSGVEDMEKNNNEWQSGWRLQPEIILETRHVRLLPYKQEHINEQLNKYKSIINR